MPSTHGVKRKPRVQSPRQRKAQSRRKPTSRSSATQSAESTLVVGIGASAGGLEALKVFFGSMPPKTGLIFVVVVHLDPTHESLMPELLSHVTRLTVESARDRQLLEPDHVYIIPPNRILTVDQGLVRVREAADRRTLRGTIDHFFRSLAESEGDRAVAIVLSGTGTEGTLGTRAVKAEGGLVMAQTPDTAAQPGMPASAIATGLVDVVLAPDKMADALLNYARNRRVHRVPAPAADQKPPEGLPAILAVLRARTKYDFRGYKKGTLQRRIERRMGLLQIDGVGKYVDHLRSHPAEVDQLFKDLLIGVTSFFRDPPAFDELATRVLAECLRHRDPDTPIRIWVPGCSTGEEAYSIAIVLAEQIAAAQSECRVQIFATDIDEASLEVARAGTYPDSIALDVSPDRLQRFFTRDDHRYTVNKTVRESVVFAVQNLTSDPPFSKLDLVSCRNVLIYLEPEMQQKLLALFHFALTPGGYLFLGSAEGVGPLDELFTPLSKRRRIFRRLEQASRPPLAFPIPGLAATDASRTGAKIVSEPTIAARSDQILMDHFAPAAVVVRSNGHIVRFYGAMERYMTLPKGEAVLDLLTLAREPLKPTLRAALHDAVRRSRQTVLEAFEVHRDQERTLLRITVKPVNGPGTERLWLVIFEEVAQPGRPASSKAARSHSDLARRLEAELRATKKEQQHLVEQLESSNEELKAANEEVLSMNEELQSTNEELTTSKEELQSMNEELTTLNAQLQDKVHELTTVNDDLANLLVSTDIATVFLDTDLRVKRFTTAASQLLNLQNSDTGRPLNHIAPNLIDVDLSRDARAVLEKLTPVEKEVAAHDGRQYFVRVLPYRTEGKAVQGIVLTLVDVTTLKQAERDVRAAREQVAEELRRMTRLHELSTHLVSTGDLEALMDDVLRAAVAITGADMGSLQRSDEAGVLTVVAHTGFDRASLDVFEDVDAHVDSAYAAALTTRQRVLADDATSSPLFSGRPSAPVLLAIGARAVQSTPLYDRTGRFLGIFSTYYRSVHHFDDVELRWLDLVARNAADVLERQHTEDLLAESHNRLDRQVSERTKWLRLIHEISQTINDTLTWDEALRKVLRVLCLSENWRVGFIYLRDREEPDVLVPVISHVDDERLRPFHDLTMQQRFSRGEGIPGRAFAEQTQISIANVNELRRQLPLRAEAATAAGLCDAVAVPIAVGDGVIGVLELLSDVDHASEHGPLVGVMRDVGNQIGRVLERERTAALTADHVWREQQRLLHTLHDSLGQTLTGLGMLSTSLRQHLEPDSTVDRTAVEIARQAQHAVDQMRMVVKDLFPVDVDAETLMAALRELASATESLHKIPVRVDGSAPVGLHNGKVATELYRIAQEAVTNGVKHAQARAITIRFDQQPWQLRLRIVDDGVGFRPGTSDHGMGLQIMRYRAESIGASLTVEPRLEGGTVVTCTLRQMPSTEPPTHRSE